MHLISLVSWRETLQNRGRGRTKPEREKLDGDKEKEKRQKWKSPRRLQSFNMGDRDVLPLLITAEIPSSVLF